MSITKEIAKFGNVVGRKNYLINGNFDIWQRGDNFPLDAGTRKYTADRWTISSNRSFERIESVVDSAYMARVTAFNDTTPSIYGSVELSVVGKRYPLMPNTNYTLSYSVVAPAGVNLNVRVAYRDRPAAGEAIFILPAAGDFETVGVATGEVQKITVTFNTGEVTPASSNQCLEIIILTDQTNGSFDIGQVQLEKGSIATDFEYRSIGEELALCQRYYNSYTGSEGGCGGNKYDGSNGATNMFNGSLHFPVQMRGIPSLSVNWGSLENCVAGASQVYNKGATLRVNVSSTGFYRAYSGTITADAEL